MTASQLNTTALMNYTLVSSYCRPHREHGGSCIFALNDNLTILERADICSYSKEMHIEIAAIQVVEINLIIICIYRSCTEGDIDIFFMQLECILALILNENARILLTGDLNIDLLKYSKNRRTILSLCDSFNLRSFVNFPTRVKETSKTALDHVYSDIDSEDVCVKPLDSCISDHRAVQIKISFQSNRSSQKHTICRLTSNRFIEKFFQSTANLNWNVLIEQLPPISSLRYDEFIKKIVHLFQSSCPHKNVASKPRTKWITAEICASQEFLQLISMYVERNPENTELLTYYMQHKTRHMGMLRKARKEFINNTIALSDNTSRALWNVIRSETNKGSSGGGELVLLRTAMCGPGAAPRQLAEQLNQYYLAVVRDTPLRPDIPAASLFLRERVPTTESTMFLRPFTVDELIKIIQSIKKKRTKDINDMPTDLLHKLPVQLLHIMCDLFNDCILDGQYPDSMKIVKISPVYKGSGSKTDHKKYRPIAIVPAVSKAFEMGLCNRLNSFMAHHELFCSSQHAYQPGRSTRGAARRLLRAVSAQLEAGRRVAAVFLDLSRAFDLVDHQLIIAKLAHYGVRGTAAFVHFYLTVSKLLS